MQIKTERRPWRLLKSLTAAGSALDANTLDSKPAGAVDIDRDMNAKKALLMFAVDGTDGQLNVLEIYAGRNPNKGPAQRVATITLTAGTMKVNADPETGAATDLDLYCDTITIDTNSWVENAAVGNDTANNGLQVLLFDLWEVNWLYVVATTLNSTKVNAYISEITAGRE